MNDRTWTGQGNCAFCDSEEVNYGDFEFEVEAVSQEAECFRCDRRFREVYLLWSAVPDFIYCNEEGWDADETQEVMSPEAAHFLACEALVKRIAENTWGMGEQLVSDAQKIMAEMRV